MHFEPFSTISKCIKKTSPFFRRNYQFCALVITLILYFTIFFRIDNDFHAHVDATQEISREHSKTFSSLRDTLQILISSKHPSIYQVHAVLERWIVHHRRITSFSLAELATNDSIRSISGTSSYQDDSLYKADSVLHATFLHRHHSEKYLLRPMGDNLIYTTALYRSMLPQNLQHFSILLDVDLGSILDAKCARRIQTFFVAFFIFFLFITLCNVNLFYRRNTSSSLLRLFIPLTAIIVIYLVTIGFFIVTQHRAMQNLFFLTNTLATTTSSQHCIPTVQQPDSGFARSFTHHNQAANGTPHSFSQPCTTGEHLMEYLEQLHKKQHQRTDLTLFLGLIFFTLGTFLLYRRLSGLNQFITTTTDHTQSLEARNNAILTHANVGIAVHEMIFSEDGTPSDYQFIATNPAFDKITGLDSRNIIGKRVTEVLPGIEKTNFIRLYGKVVKTGVPLAIEEFSAPLQKHFSINAFVIQKNIFAVIFYDITERKAATSLHFLSTQVFENIPIGLHVYRVDISGEIPSFSLISSNRSANHLLSYYYVNYSGKAPDFFFIKADGHELLSEMNAAFKSGTSNTRFEITCKIPSGDERTFLFTYFSLPDSRAGLLFEDVSKQRKTQNELAASQLNLTTALADSKRMTKDMQQSIELRRQFLTNMTHELHTPLTAIIGITNILDRTLKNSEHHNQITTIHSNAHHLYRHINNFIDVAQVDSGSVIISPVNFHLDIDVLRVLSELYFMQAHRKGISLSLIIDKDTELGLTGDADKLTKILGHLLDNAIKFTEKGMVSLHVETIDKTSDSVKLKFTIDDSGIGITEELQKKLFSKFVQVDSSSTRPFGGTGLGLYLTKQLTESMQGSISFISVYNLGSTFYLTLPFAIRKTAPEPLFSESKLLTNAKPSRSSAQKPRILLVEDNTVNQELASYILNTVDIDFDMAENGAAALRILKHVSYDLVFMDCQMPEMDGYETTRQLRRSLGKNATVPVVALTAHFTDEDRQKCLDAGMNDYFTKPISTGKVKAALKNWVSPEIVIVESDAKNDPSPPAAVQQNDISIWNRSAMLELCMHDEGIMSKVIAEFLISTTRYLEDLASAVRSHDFAKIVKSAHTIKGVAATLCADSLKESAVQIIRLAEAENIHDYASVVNGIARNFIDLKAMLTADIKTEMDNAT